MLSMVEEVVIARQKAVALPTDEVWDGGVIVTSDGCAGTQTECVFGATQPDVDVLWELALPPEIINPAFLESVGQ